MPIKMYSDHDSLSKALSDAGYEVVGNESNLIQATRSESGYASQIYIDAGGSLRAQITQGGMTQASKPSYNGHDYVVTRNGQLVTNITTDLDNAADLPAVLNDIELIAAGSSRIQPPNRLTSLGHTHQPAHQPAAAQPGTSGRDEQSSNDQPNNDQQNSGRVRVQDL